MNTSLTKVAALVVVVIYSSYSAGETLIEQHKKMMIDAISQCNTSRVAKLLETPYVDPNEVLNDQSQVHPQYRGVMVESYASWTAKTQCKSSDVLNMWKSIQKAGGDLDRGSGGMNAFNNVFSNSRSEGIYELAKFLLKSGINPQGTPPTYTVGVTHTTLVVLFYNMRRLSKDDAVELIGAIGKNFRDWGYKTDLNHRNTDGSTALLLAVDRRAEVEVVDALVSEGADLEMPTRNGFSPHSLLLYEECTSITRSQKYQQRPASYKERNNLLMTYFTSIDQVHLLDVKDGPPCPSIY